MTSEQPITSRTPEQRFASLVNKPYDGPVPELLLYRLLNATEVELRERFSQKYPNSDLIELRLGYVLQEPAIDNQPEQANNNAPLYWVGWGRLAGYENLLETGEEISEAQLAIYDAQQAEIELSIPLDDLIARLTEEMISQTPPKLLRGKELKVFLITFITASVAEKQDEWKPPSIDDRALLSSPDSDSDSEPGTPIEQPSKPNRPLQSISRLEAGTLEDCNCRPEKGKYTRRRNNNVDCGTSNCNPVKE